MATIKEIMEAKEEQQLIEKYKELEKQIKSTKDSLLIHDLKNMQTNVELKLFLIEKRSKSLKAA